MLTAEQFSKPLYADTKLTFSTKTLSLFLSFQQNRYLIIVFYKFPAISTKFCKVSICILFVSGNFLPLAAMREYRDDFILSNLVLLSCDIECDEPKLRVCVFIRILHPLRYPPYITANIRHVALEFSIKKHCFLGSRLRTTFPQVDFANDMDMYGKGCEKSNFKFIKK